MKIRVLHVIDSLDLGGGQTALLNLLGALDRNRFELEVACLHGRGVFWDDFAQLGLPMHSLSPRKWWPLYLWRLAWLICTRRPRIVHCHLFGANWIAKPLAALLGVRVRIAHDQCNDALRYENALALALDRWTNRLSSHVCAVSASTRDFLLHREHLAPEKVSLVYNAIDLARYSPPASKSAARPVVLGIGRLHPQKDFALFLQTAAELTRRGLEAEYRLAGTGPDEEKLRALAGTLGLAERVRFLGHVADPRPLYAEASVLLMTSRFEGTPLTALEAMAMRLPIVAPRLDGLGEILVSGEEALLVEGREIASFADAVERLLADPALATRLALAAERKVHARFSAETMARQVEAIYDRCLGERGVEPRAGSTLAPDGL